jgi:hypothetical protein
MTDMPRIDSLVCRAEPLNAVIFKLHSIIHTEYTNQQFKFTIYSRDTRVIEQPKPLIMTHDQIVGSIGNSISESTPSSVQISAITLNLENVSLLHALDFICEVSGNEYEINAPRDGVIAISIGPSELIGSHPRLRRRSFRFEHPTPNGLSGIAKELSAVGPSLAFNPDSRLLTVIDDPSESFSDFLIDLLGAKLIYTEVKSSEL